LAVTAHHRLIIILKNHAFSRWGNSVGQSVFAVWSLAISRAASAASRLRSADAV
jgi:hypothetical protein